MKKERQVTSNYADYAAGFMNGNDVLRGSYHNDCIWTGAGTDTVLSGGGDDVIFIGTGKKRIKAGVGEDIAVFEGPGTAYEILVKQDGRMAVWGTEVDARLKNVEKLLFRTDKLASEVLDVSALHKDKINRVQLDPSRPLYGSDKGDALYAVGDNVTMVGGRGNDCFIGKASGAKVRYEGSMLDYNIYRDAGHDVIVSHASIGTDRLTNIDRLVFGNGGEITTDKIAYQLQGGKGDDRLVGIGRDTKVFYQGSMFNYAIHRNEDGSLLVRSKKFGTDTLVEIDWLYFSDGSRIHESFIPDEWLGTTGFKGLYDMPTDPATGQ